MVQELEKYLLTLSNVYEKKPSSASLTGLFCLRVAGIDVYTS